jgi:hypothetical protein
MAEREIPIRAPEAAYTRLARVKDAFRFIRSRAEHGSAALERTQSRFVGQTYGVEAELIKKMKARFRNELSFNGEGK